MTPEESKARELVDKFYPFTLYTDATLNGKRDAYNRAKQCAIISLDEIIIALKFTNDSKNYVSQHKYWQSIKDKINSSENIILQYEGEAPVNI